jgi:hypothetical protein
MSALGSLVASLALEYAQYTRGLDKSGQEALKFGKRQQEALDRAGRATDEFFDKTTRRVAGAVAAYVSVSKVIEELNSSIDDLAAVDDLSQKTGSAAENISKMQKVARQFGGDMAAIDPLLIKLAKGMASVDSETNKTHKALDALGVSSRDAAGKLRDPSEVLIEVAKRLQIYEDGASKAALVNDAMGKSAADQLPFLNDLAENVDKVGGASSKSASRASDFKDKLGGVNKNIDELFQAVTIQALPAMSDFAGALNDVSKSGLTLSDNNSVADWADDTAVGIARLLDVIKTIPGILRAIGGSFEVVFADIKLLSAQSQTMGAGAAAALLHGENPWANFGKEWDARAAVLEEANKRYSELWNVPANQMEQAVLARIANRGSQPASPYSNPQPGRATLNYLSGTEAKDKKLNINNSYVADVFGASIEDLNREGVFADQAARVHEVGQQHIADFKEAQAAVSAYNEDWNVYLGGLEQSLESLTRENELYGLNATQIAEVNLQRAEENLAIAERNGVSQEYLDRLSREVDLRKRILEQTGALEQKKVWTTVFQSIEQTAHDTFVSVFDSGKNAFDRLRDTLKNGLLDLLYQMTIKKWIINVGASVSGTGAAGLASAAGLDGIAGAGGAGGGLSIGNLFSMGKSLISGFQGSLAGSIESFGATLANGMGGFADTIGGFLGTYSAQIANVLPFAGAAIQLLSGDAKGAAFTAAGAAIGSIIPGIGTAIGGVIGSIVGGLIGGNSKGHRAGAAVRGSYSNGDFTLGKVDKGSASKFDKAYVDPLTQLSEAFAKQLGGFLDAMGLADNITTYASYKAKPQGRTATRFGGTVNGVDFGMKEVKYSRKDKEAFSKFVSAAFGPVMVEAIKASSLSDGIKALFDGMTDKTQVLNMMSATVSLNSAQEQLAERFGLTVDQAGLVSEATGKVGDELVKFVTNLAGAANSFKTVGESLLEFKSDVTDTFNEIYGTIVQDAVMQTVTRQVEVKPAAGKQYAGPYASIVNGMALQGNSLLENLPKKYKTVTENILTYVDRLIPASLQLPDNLKDFDALLKSIDKTSAAGQEMFADLFSLRENFVQYTNSINGLKTGVKGAIFGMLSASEQQSQMQADLAELFGSLNMSIPGSVEELIALGRSIDYTTEQGLNLAAAFPSLVSAFVQTQEQVANLIDTLGELDTDRFRTLVDFTRAQRYVENGISLSNLPSYDVGTSYVPADGPALIHQGERIFTSAENAQVIEAIRSSGNSNADLAAEIRQLRSDLRSSQLAIATSTNKAAKVLEKFDRNGIVLSPVDNEGNTVVLTVEVAA